MFSLFARHWRNYCDYINAVHAMQVGSVNCSQKPLLALAWDHPSSNGSLASGVIGLKEPRLPTDRSIDMRRKKRRNRPPAREPRILKAHQPQGSRSRKRNLLCVSLAGANLAIDNPIGRSTNSRTLATLDSRAQLRYCHADHIRHDDSSVKPFEPYPHANLQHEQVSQLGSCTSEPSTASKLYRLRVF